MVDLLAAASLHLICDVMLTFIGAASGDWQSSAI
jgi:hypothetical protein